VNRATSARRAWSTRTRSLYARTSFPPLFATLARRTLETLQTTEPEPVHVGAFVPRELKAQLVERAHRDDRSVSAVIRVAISRHLEDEEITHSGGVAA